MEAPYKNRVGSVLRAEGLQTLDFSAVQDMIASTRALVFDKHFVLMSGDHSDAFFIFSRIARQPAFMFRITAEMLAWVEREGVGDVDVVLGTSRAGMLLAYDIAREMNCKQDVRTGGVRAAYARSDVNGATLRDLLDGSEIKRGDRVLVVNDICTTGKGIQTLISLAESYRGKVVGVCVFANRSTRDCAVDRIKGRYKFHAVVDLLLSSWKTAEASRDLLAKIPHHSRDLNSLISERPLEEILEEDLVAA